ncbi:MAG: hypothetical protein JWM57_1887 [Phycisphaerales bacterium]|nr:hypothetical protein [Phycisphaerales bacterium]
MFRSKLFAATVLVTATLACAQNQPGDQGPQGQGPQGQGQRGPGGMGGMGGPGGQMNFDQMKTTLHASDEEWKVISPAVRKVVNARRIAEAGLLGAGNGGGGMRGGRGGPGGRGGNDAFGGPNNQRPGGGPMGGPDGQGGPGGGNGGGNGGFPPPPPDGNGPPPADAPQVNRDDIPMPGAGGGDQQGGRRMGGQGGQGGQGGPGGQGGFGGQGGPGGMMGGMGGATGPVATAMAELKTAADGGKATAEELNTKVTAVRAAREKARAAVKSAVEELQALVTPEQEAALVGLGVIE